MLGASKGSRAACNARIATLDSSFKRGFPANRLSRNSFNGGSLRNSSLPELADGWSRPTLQSNGDALQGMKEMSADDRLRLAEKRAPREGEDKSRINTTPLPQILAIAKLAEGIARNLAINLCREAGFSNIA